MSSFSVCFSSYIQRQNTDKGLQHYKANDETAAILRFPKLADAKIGNAMFYPVVVHQIREKQFAVIVPDVKACSAVACNQSLALKEVRVALQGRASVLAARGQKMPLPTSTARLRYLPKFKGRHITLVSVSNVG